MIEKRPAILIYTFQPNPEILQELCAGIEEEGVFYELTGRDSVRPDADDQVRANLLAWQAAQDSMLGSGIGVSGSTAVLQMRGLEPGHNVESYRRPAKEQSRKLGANSARIIKKMPLK